MTVWNANLISDLYHYVLCFNSVMRYTQSIQIVNLSPHKSNGIGCPVDYLTGQIITFCLSNLHFFFDFFLTGLLIHPLFRKINKCGRLYILFIPRTMIEYNTRGLVTVAVWFRWTDSTFSPIQSSVIDVQHSNSQVFAWYLSHSLFHESCRMNISHTSQCSENATTILLQSAIFMIKFDVWCDRWKIIK